MQNRGSELASLPIKKTVHDSKCISCFNVSYTKHVKLKNTFTIRGVIMKRIIKLVIFSTFIFAFATLVFGESKEEKKVALLIANDDYARDLGKLLQPIKEAEALKKALESIGFKVILLKNANKASMKRTLKSFKDQSTGNIAFFHYGGHAVSVGGKNYLIPLETKIEDEDDLEDECFSVDAVMKNMQGSSNIVLVYFSH